MRPSTHDHPAFAITYIHKVGEENPIKALFDSQHILEAQLKAIPDAVANSAYADGKWTVRQVLRHTIDTERIFAYRALSIARGEKQSLPPFDEGDYAHAADAALSELQDLKKEFLLVRQSTVCLFRSFPPFLLENAGIVGGSRVTVNALAYMIIGHWRHHAMLFCDRYGIDLPYVHE